MKRVLALGVVLGLGLTLSACGSNASSAVDAAKSVASAAASAASSAASKAADDASSAASGAGSDSSSPVAAGDCSSITKDDLAKFIVYTQILAQVRDKAGVDAMAAGQMTDYTPAKFDAVLAKLAFLSSDAQAGPALSALTAANDKVKQLASGKPSQADFDQYQKDTGGIGGILKDQVNINIALSKACPNIV